MNSISQEKLTAYALNELPENERQELETLLEQSPENLVFAEETRDFCQLLQQTIGSSEPEGLSDSQKADIAKTIPFAGNASLRRWPVIAFGTSAAAAVAVWLSWPYLTSKVSPTETVAALPKEDEAARFAAELATREKAVEEKRTAMLAVMKQYRILDFSGVHSSFNSMGGSVNDGKEEVYKSTQQQMTAFESEVSKLKSQLKTLEGITQEDELIEQAAAMGLEGPTLKEVLPKFQEAQTKLSEAKASGLAESHPKVAALSQEVQGKKALLGDAVRSLKKSLDTKVEIAEIGLESLKRSNNNEGELVGEKARRSEYQMAKRAYEQEFALLNEMRDHAIQKNPEILAKIKEIRDSEALNQNIDYSGGTTTTSGTLASAPGKPAETPPVDRLYAPGEAKPAATQPVTSITESTPPALTLATAEDAAPATKENRFRYPIIDPDQYAGRENQPEGFLYPTESASPRTPSAESYTAPPENPFKRVAAEPLSTFSIDVDTASYANVRRFLNMGQRPPAEAVRVEELINYFRYAYPAAEAGKPCSLTADLVVCPWNENHRLARVAVKARVDENRPKANLVFLLDVSGSMSDQNKLPLVKQSLKLLVDKLTENDRVSIVVYAGSSGLVLPPTHGENKKVIVNAIDNLQPGGSTNGASGITLAYEQARKEFIKDGVNRVILATDGDFNVGISDQSGLQSLIEKEAKSGVFLSVLGYGMGNLKDSTMETLADKGNGNYAYIDSLGEARKVLSEEMSSTLVTVAKDVKIQIEFNPSKVRAYKLLGYENRMLAKEDFNDDKKDAGEMGSGHTVTALYEITPTDAPPDVAPVDPLKYQPTAAAAPAVQAPKNDSPEIMTVKLRYKAPDADVSQLMELPVQDRNAAVASAPGDFQFATAVAGYGLLLRGSKQVGSLNWEMIRQMAKAGKGEDAEGYRGEFLQLVEKAAGIVPIP